MPVEEATFDVTLKKSLEKDPWGFRIIGGRDYRQPLSIAKVEAGSEAELKGVRPQDIVIRINGEPTSAMTHMEAKNKVKDTNKELKMVLQRGSLFGTWRPTVTPQDAGHYQTPPYKVSLVSDVPEVPYVGYSHNVTARPWGAAEGDAERVPLYLPAFIRKEGPKGGLHSIQHLQYNSPVGLYRPELLSQIYRGQKHAMGFSQRLKKKGGDEVDFAIDGDSPVYGLVHDHSRYSHGQVSSRYIEKPEAEEMRYVGYSNPKSQSDAFKRLQKWTEKNEIAPGPEIEMRQYEESSGVRGVGVPSK